MPPEQPAAERPDLQAKFEALIAKADFRGLKALLQKAEEAPNEGIVQKAYNVFLKSGYLRHIQALAEISGVAPEFDPEILQERYKLAVERNWPDVIAEMRNITGTEPDPGLLRDKYRQLLLGGSIKEAMRLGDSFGVKPEAEVVQEAYNSLIQVGGVEKFRQLKAWTGIEPQLDPEMVQKRYDLLLANDWLDVMEDLRAAVSIEPEFDEAKVDALYLKSLDDVFAWRDIYRATGRKPSLEAIKKIVESAEVERHYFPGVFVCVKELDLAVPAEIMQSLLNRIAAQEPVWLWLRRETYQLVINPAAIQHAYQALFARGDWAVMKEIMAETGIRPEIPPQKIAETYQVYLKRRDFSVIARFAELTGVKPQLDAGIIQQAALDELTGLYINSDTVRQILALAEPKLVIPPDVLLAQWNKAYKMGYPARYFDEFLKLFPIALPEAELHAWLKTAATHSANLDFLRTLLDSQGDRVKPIWRDVCDNLLADIGIYGLLFLHDKGIKIRLSPEQVQKSYIVYAGEFRVTTAQVIYKISLKRPAWSVEAKQEYYQKLMRVGLFSDIQKWADILGEPPVFDDAAMQEVFSKSLMPMLQAGMLETSLRMSGKRPDAKLLARVAAAYLSEDLLNDAAAVQKILGEKLPFDADQVKAKYQEYIGAHVRKYEKLKELTGIEPPPIDPASFQASFKLKEWPNEDLEAALRLGLKLPFNETDLQAEYLDLIINGALKRVVLIKDLARIPIDATSVQEGYRHYLERKAFHVLTELMEISGQKISPDLVNEYYNIYLGERSLEMFLRLYDATRVAAVVDMKQAKEFYLELLEDKLDQKYLNYGGYRGINTVDLKLLARFRQATSLTIDIPAEKLQELYQDAFTLRKFDKAREIFQASGVAFQIDQTSLQESYKAEISRFADLSSLEVLYEVCGNRPVLPDERWERDCRAILSRSPSTYRGNREILGKIWPKDRPFPDIPWGPMYVRLEKLQAPATRAEYDPWKTDLDLLLDRVAVRSAGLNKDKPEDAEIVYEYVRQYGMNNLPLLFRHHVNLTRAKDVRDIPDETKVALAAIFKTPLEDFATPGAVSAELKKFVARLREDLLADRTPKEIVDSDLALELFNMLRGKSSFGAHIEPRQIIGDWHRTLMTKPELALLPEGYKTVSFEVPTESEGEAGLEAKQERLEAKTKDILENADLRTTLAKVHSAFEAAVGMSLGGTEYLRGSWWRGWQKHFLGVVDQDIAAAEQKAAEASGKAAAGIAKQLDGLKTLRTELQQVSLDSLPADSRQYDQVFAEFLNRLSGLLPKKIDGAEQFLRQLSAYHALLGVSAGRFQEIAAMVGDETRDWTPDEIRSWNELFSGSLVEHYLNPEQRKHGVDHVPLASATVKRLQQVWSAAKMEEHPLALAERKLAALSDETKEYQGKTVKVSMVPARGILRLFSGSLADACTINETPKMAAGQFARVTSYSFVTGQGTTQERLRGSVLAIETQTPQGEPVLVVRANNPAENLIAQVDAEALINKILNEMKKLAGRRGIKTVVVPIDVARASCSQRTQVEAYYRKHYGDRPRVALVNEPETNFNGYKNWLGQDEGSVAPITD